MRRVGLYTLGCKVSQYETEAIAEGFETLGFVRVPFTEVADVYVVNTCTVTAESDRKSRQMIRRAIKTNPNAVIMVTGCYSQVAAEELLRIDGVAYVGGTDRKMKLPTAAVALLSEREAGKLLAPVCDSAPLDGAAFEPMCVKHAPRTRAYVKIEDGCECRCAYCAIPGARGNVRSKAPRDVLNEVWALADGGTREVVLTGIEIASYGMDFDSFRLIDLLELLEREGPHIRLRLGSITPEIMREDFVSRLAKLKKIVPHFHISMQSGSNAVLAGMKRRYTAEMAQAALGRLRAAIPQVEFTTDMMTGFPGEGEKEFAETLAFTEAARFLDMHVFAYSKRKNTPAARYEHQVPQEEKHRRSKALIDLAVRLREERLDEILRSGRTLSVLLETFTDGKMTGHSEEFVACVAPADTDLHGALCLFRPSHHKDGVMYGEITNVIK